MFRSKRLASVDLQFYIPGIQRTEEGVVVGEEEEDGTETGMEAEEVGGIGDMTGIVMVTDGRDRDTGRGDTGGIGTGNLETE